MNTEWLLTGKGEMLKEDNQNPISDTTINQLEMFKDILKEKDQRILELKEEIAFYRDLLRSKCLDINKQSKTG